MAESKKIYVARESGSATYKGEDAIFVKGVTRVAEGHWLLKRVAYAFEPVEDHVHFGGVERATANPGGGRNARVTQPKPEPEAESNDDDSEAEGEAEAPKPSGLTLSSMGR